jgi:hypothetical protein
LTESSATVPTTRRLTENLHQQQNQEITTDEH